MAVVLRSIERGWVAAAMLLFPWAEGALADTIEAKVSSSTDMQVTLSGTDIQAMTMGKRRQFCIDPRAHTKVGEHVSIERQGTDGCAWSVDSGNFHGYAQWTVRDDKYSFSGAGSITQRDPGTGRGTLTPPPGAKEWTVTVSGTTVWDYLRRAPGGEVKNQETETGTATISFKVVAGPTPPPTPPTQPPPQPPQRDSSYPGNGLPLCGEALSFFGMEQPGQTHLRQDMDTIDADFTQAMDAYRKRTGKEPTVSLPDSVVAVPAALNWLFAEGGTAANLGYGPGMSQDFVFTRPQDAALLLKRQVMLYDGRIQARKGSEAALLQAVVNRHREDGGRKLSTGDVFGLALDQTGGDARLASLLAHNMLRSLARGADGNFTGITQDQTFFTTYLQTIRGGPLAKPPAGGDPHSQDYAGPWYHMYGTMFYELQVRGAQAADLSRGSMILPPGTLLSPGWAQWLVNFVQGGGQTLDSDIANKLEQYGREWMAGRTPDPEKYCVNVWGAKLGASLFNALKAGIGPRGATQSITGTPLTPGPAPKPTSRPLEPSQPSRGGTQVISQ